MAVSRLTDWMDGWSIWRIGVGGGGGSGGRELRCRYVVVIFWCACRLCVEVYVLRHLRTSCSVPPGPAIHPSIQSASHERETTDGSLGQHDASVMLSVRSAAASRLPSSQTELPSPECISRHQAPNAPNEARLFARWQRCHSAAMAAALENSDGRSSQSRRGSPARPRRGKKGTRQQISVNVGWAAADYVDLAARSAVVGWAPPM
ncbi:hypothetical protein IWX46DRAFT_182554 [Phyllosticta citricarpa]|uniref:Uncharacterized protein n=1 Tax=Phyllosticta citricarpa TaxID=55181 RepID=A0ABR1M408_9PEZI